MPAGWAALLIGAAVVLTCLIAFDEPSFVTRIVNSDTLLPASLVWDVQQHDYAWRGFQLPRVPSIFPDLVAYGVLQAATGAWRTASFGYGLFSMLVLVAAAGAIIASIARCSLGTGAQAFLMVAVPVLLLEIPVTQASQHLAPSLFAPVHHGGAFLLALVALRVAWNCVQRPRLGTGSLLFVLVTLGALSDRLFLVSFHWPLFVAVGYAALTRRITRQSARRLAGVALAGLAAGWSLDLLLQRQPDPAISWPGVPKAAMAFLASPIHFAAEAPPVFVLCYLLPLSFVLLPWLCRLHRAVRRRPMELRAFDAPAFWSIVAPAGILGAVASTAILYVDTQTYRYALPLLWWPIIVMASAVARVLVRVGPRRATAGLGAMTLALGTFYLWPGPHPPAVLAWHHPLEACLLDARDAEGLEAGLASYWYSRSLAASSDWRLQIDQLKDDGTGMYWGNDRYWYTHDVHDGSRPPRYNYIVMALLDEQAITARYGAPSRVLHCAESKVWVYDDAAALRQRLTMNSPQLLSAFLEAGEDAVCVPADQLVSDDRVMRDGALVVHREKPVGKRVTWGPFIELPPGHWMVSLFYRLASDAPGRDHWDVAADYGRTKLFEGKLPPVTDAVGRVDAEFVLSSPAKAVEVHSFLAGTGTLELTGLGIVRPEAQRVPACGPRDQVLRR